MEFCVRARSSFNYSAGRLTALELHWGVSWQETAGAAFGKHLQTNVSLEKWRERLFESLQDHLDTVIARETDMPHRFK